MNGGGEKVLRGLACVPGGPELLELAGKSGEAALVGGAARDLLLERTPRELDVVVEGEAQELARALAERVGDGAEVSGHERFGTARVSWPGGRVDIATRRAESYARPGALPDVRAGTVEEDMARRDFTVNAIAVPLAGPRRGELLCAEHALEDLRAGRLRVLHERSFLDDPTRVLRLARYAARLSFEIEPRTCALALEAVEGGALDTVSRARVGTELRLALAEAGPVGALEAMERLGVLRALEPRIEVYPHVARRALEILPADGRPDLMLVASILLPIAVDPAEDPEPVMYELLDSLEFTAPERETIMRTALVAPSLTREMQVAETPSEIREALFAHTIEAVALGGALEDDSELGVADAVAREWLNDLRHVRLRITGEDLLAAGVPAGPEIGRRLAIALDCKLDSELEEDTAEEELRIALEVEL